MNPAQTSQTQTQPPRRATAALLWLALAALFPAQASAENADALGMLFFSPAERQEIARARNDSRPVAEQPPASLQLDGLVKRADGRSTAWLNRGMPDSRSSRQARSTWSVISAGWLKWVTTATITRPCSA